MFNKPKFIIYSDTVYVEKENIKTEETPESQESKENEEKENDSSQSTISEAGEN